MLNHHADTPAIPSERRVKIMAEEQKTGATTADVTSANQEGTAQAQKPAQTPQASSTEEKAAEFMIPKHRFDEVSNELKQAKLKIAEYEAASKQTADPETDWKSKYEALLKENQEKEAAAAQARRRETIMNSIGTDAHDKALVYDLLKLETIKVEGDKVEGLAEQLKELKKAKPFLFKPAAQVAKPAAQGQSIEKSFGKQLAEGVAAPSTQQSAYFKN